MFDYHHPPFPVDVVWNPVLRFVCFGDWGLSTSNRSILFHYLRHQPLLDFIILLGDNFYYNGVNDTTDSQWNIIKTDFPQHVRLYPVLGNHDHHLHPFAQVQYSSTLGNNTWKMPFLYYDEVMALGNDTVHFLFLDTCLLAPFYTLQLFEMCSMGDDKKREFTQMVEEFSQFQKQWITHTLSRSQSRWKIVCGHYPLYSHGNHALSTELQQFLLPLFRQHKVHLYLSGHDHNGQVILKENTYFVVSGAMSEHHSPSQIRGYPTLFHSSHMGYFYCEISKHQLLLYYKDKQGHQSFVTMITP